MDIYFGGPLVNDCRFVDNTDVISTLKISIRTLDQIENNRDKCSSLKYNSMAYLSGYVDFLYNESTEFSIVQANERAIKEEINKRVQNGSYHGEFDYELLRITKDLNRLENPDLAQDQSLIHTLNLGSEILAGLEQYPECSANIQNHILGPSISMMGNVASYTSPSSYSLHAAVLISISQFIGNTISYISRIKERSYQSYKDLILSSNYYMSYKCALKNIEKISCDLEEEERYSHQMNLDQLADQIDKLDIDGDFLALRHLRRHRYRISKIISELENIYNSSESINDIQTIVIYQTRIKKLGLMSRNPILKNKHYLKKMQEADMPQEDVINSWDGWDHNKMEWKTWWKSYFHGYGDYLSERIDFICSTLAATGDEFYKNIFDKNQRVKCDPSYLQKSKDIDKFIKEVLSEALVELQQKIAEVNSKIKNNSNTDKLFSSIISQEINTGNPDFKEYSLTELLDKFDNHAAIFKDTSAKHFAQNIREITKEIKKLVLNSKKLFKDEKPFSEMAKEVYDEIATISNNGVKGGVLDTSFIEGQLSSYFEDITNQFLLQDINSEPKESRSKRFVSYNYLANLYMNFLNARNIPDSQGSSNLSIMNELRDSFWNVFGSDMETMLKKDLKRYDIDNELFLREVVHSCLIQLPFLKDDFLHNTSDTCEEILKENGGVPFLKNNSKEKYPLFPKTDQDFPNLPSFTERCYYRNYQKEEVMREIYLRRERNSGRRY